MQPGPGIERVCYARTGCKGQWNDQRGGLCVATLPLELPWQLRVMLDPPG